MGILLTLEKPNQTFANFPSPICLDLTLVAIASLSLTAHAFLLSFIQLLLSDTRLLILSPGAGRAGATATSFDNRHDETNETPPFPSSGPRTRYL